MSIETIINYLRVDHLIASSGQPEEQQFESIAAAGFRVVINLAMPDSENALPDEGSIVTELKMVYVHIPVPFDAPDIHHIKTFFEIMDAFYGQKIWVHCVVNYRVSAFMYLYLRHAQGVAEHEARKAILPSWQPNELWKKLMRISKEDTGL